MYDGSGIIDYFGELIRFKQEGKIYNAYQKKLCIYPIMPND